MLRAPALVCALTAAMLYALVVAPAVAANAPPEVAVTSPNGGEVLEGVRKIMWSGADGDGDNVTYTIYASVDGGAYWSEPLYTTSYVESPAPAHHEWLWFDTAMFPDTVACVVKVTAADSAGGWAEDVSNAAFTLANRVPAPALLSPENGALVVDDSSPALDWADAYTPMGLRDYIVQVSSNALFTRIVDNASGLTESAYRPGHLADGRCWWRVRARDNALSISPWSEARQFEVYTGTPSIRYVVVGGGTGYVRSPSADVGVGATNAESVSLSPDNLTWSAWVPFSPLLDFELSPGDGPKEVFVRVMDKAGRVASGSAAVTLDTTIGAPSLTLADTTSGSADYTNALEVGAYIAEDQDIVAWILSDGHATPAEDSAEWVSTEPAAFVLSPGDGPKTIYVWVKDRAGNVRQAQAGATIALDTTPPSVALAEPPEGAVLESGEITILASIVDACAVDNVVVLVDGEPVDYLFDSATGGVEARAELAPGGHEVSIAATDAAGNSVVAARSFSVAVSGREVPPPWEPLAAGAAIAAALAVALYWQKRRLGTE